MSKVCNPPKVLNPRTGKCVSANYLKQLNKKQGLPSLLPIPIIVNKENTNIQNINDEEPIVPIVNVAKVAKVATEVFFRFRKMLRQPC